MPAICVHASVVWAESRSCELAGGQHVSGIADNACDREENNRLKCGRARARRDHDAEKSDRDCDQAFRAHFFTQHRSRKKSHEDRREK